MDLGNEEGGATSARRSNSSHLEEVVYAMDALAGDPRANAHYIELHKKDVARRAESMLGSGDSEDMFGYFNSLK
jgi:hypothetical protein